MRRGRAETDVSVAEIMGRSLTPDAALRARSAEAASGSIKVTLETGAAGEVRRRSKVTKLRIRRPDGQTETRIIEEVVERRPIAR